MEYIRANKSHEGKKETALKLLKTKTARDVSSMMEIPRKYCYEWRKEYNIQGIKDVKPPTAKVLNILEDMKKMTRMEIQLKYLIGHPYIVSLEKKYGVKCKSGRVFIKKTFYDKIPSFFEDAPNMTLNELPKKYNIPKTRIYFALRRNNVSFIHGPRTKKLKHAWETVADIGNEIPKTEWDKVPSDLSMSLDRHLYNKKEQ